jgi:3-phosphoshikimate 1-carboxyvinyltransferase
MIWKVSKSRLSGSVTVPPSKSHTIRALVVATLADGTSVVRNPLTTGDGASAVAAAEGLGARIERGDSSLKVTAPHITGLYGREWLDLGNSGTSTSLFAGVAALGGTGRWFTGDDSLKTRPVKPLLAALSSLGANYAHQSPNRDIPFFVCGPLRGGNATVNGVSSQYVSSLLLSCPRAPHTTTLHVENLQEHPYVRMTMWWLDKMDICYEAAQDLSWFRIEPNQRYRPFDIRIPGDFSSATFPAVAAAVTGGRITVGNIDFSDPQGDKEVFTLLESLGAPVERGGMQATVGGEHPIRGGIIDLGSMPDALPAFSVLACAARGTTSIVNVRHARIKETDRIRVMAHELKKMGAIIEERDDGLNINPSQLTGCRVNGHSDHRVVMALAIAGMIAEGETEIETAEAATVTYPSFADDFRACGAAIETIG